MGNALLLVDIQNDFILGGALAVTDGDAVVPVANQLISCFDLVVASQDFHPKDHRSFASQHPGKNPGDVIDLGGISQVLWPDHCVMDTAGAEFVPDLNVGGITRIFQKGMHKEVDSYSSFFDNDKRYDTGLNSYLKSKNVDALYVVGLATDYCVKFSVMDALNLGFKTTVVPEGVRGVDLNEGDSQKALDEMKDVGAVIVSLDTILKG